MVRSPFRGAFFCLIATVEPPYPVEQMAVFLYIALRCPLPDSLHNNNSNCYSLMKILYGIQSLGNGHISRARILVPALRKAGFEIDFVFSGRDNIAFFDMDIFGEHCRFYPGFSIAFSRGKVNDIGTFAKNRHLRFLQDALMLNLDSYDFVLSDFEPVTAWAALVKRKKCYGISNQYAYRYPIPRYPGFWPSKVLIDHFAPADIEIGLHWHHFNQPLLPPITEPCGNENIQQNHILVYMYFEEVSEIVRFLQPFGNFRFSVYASVPAEENHGNVIVKPFSHEGFRSDFRSARGVICNAGFELGSQCLTTSKRLMVKPLKGQVEQLTNALVLQQLGRATVIDRFDPAILGQWLEGPQHTPVCYPDVATPLALWLADHRKENLSDLSQRLWKQTLNLPAYPHPYERQLHYGKIV
jgi:uncharacterized protein (TIGR00661 family)